MSRRALLLTALAVLLVGALVAVALAFGGHERLPMDPGVPSTVTTIGGRPVTAMLTNGALGLDHLRRNERHEHADNAT